MKKKSKIDQNELEKFATPLKGWLRAVWTNGLDSCRFFIKNSLYLAVEWNTELGNNGPIKYLDIDIYNGDHKKMRESCYTMYDFEGADSLANSIIKEVLTGDYKKR